MKTRSFAPKNANGAAEAERVVRNGRPMVVLAEEEYERLLRKADEWEPQMPEPNARGNYPAVEALRVSLARKILRHRREVGMSQAELARRIRIGLQSLIKIECAKASPSVAVVERIEQVLQRASAKVGTRRKAVS